MSLSDKTNWETLKKFWVTCESKNFSEASRKLNLAQRTLRTHISSLEEQLGVELFFRSGKNYMSTSLTPEGKNFKSKIDHVRSVLYNNKKIIQYDKELEEEPIVIYTTQGISSFFLPNIIDIFLKSNPQARIVVKISSSPRKLQKGEIQIRCDFWPQKNLSKVHFADLELSFYASKDFVKKSGNPKNFLELKDHKILFSLSSLDASYNLERSNYISPVLLSEDFHLSVRLCERGNGIFVIPDLIAKELNLEKVLKDEKIPTERVYMGYIDEHVDGTTLEKFLKLDKSTAK